MESLVILILHMKKLWLRAEKAMAPHSSTLAWKIPWMEKPGRLQSMGSLRVRQDWVTSLSLFTFMPWRRKWQPTPVFLPGESQDGGAWWAAVYEVAQSRTQLKWLSSSSSSSSGLEKLIEIPRSHCYKVLRVKTLLPVCLASGFCDLSNYAILSHRTPLDTTCDYNRRYHNITLWHNIINSM